MGLVSLKVVIFYIIISKSLLLIRAIPMAEDKVNKAILINFLLAFGSLFALMLII